MAEVAGEKVVMRSLFAKKKVFPELYLKTFNRDFYRQVYFHEHQGKKIQEHFLENLESRQFDPSPLFNLRALKASFIKEQISLTILIFAHSFTPPML